MKEVLVREARINDSKIIYELSNDEEVRKNSINKNFIKYEDHLNWFKSKLTDNNYKIFLFNDVDANFIGQVKFDINNCSAIISLSIHQNFRGFGYAPILLRKSIQIIFKNEKKLTKIIALIKSDNTPSVKSFIKAGFSYTGNEIINNETFQKFIIERH